ncbi:hypothetical protein SLA2020_124340 [Shorea laevis]
MYVGLAAKSTATLPIVYPPPYSGIWFFVHTLLPLPVPSATLMDQDSIIDGSLASVEKLVDSITPVID